MLTRFFQFFSLLFMVSVFVNCASEPAAQSVKQESGNTPAQTVSNETADPDLPFPVYENFSELEYLFRYQNDTTYVINFWATWCKPCVAELPYFEKLHAEKGRQKLKVILVSLDFAKDVETKLLKFVQQREMQPQVIAFIDGNYNNWIDKVHPDWGGAIPVTYIYKNEAVLFHGQQYDNFEELQTSVKAIQTQG